MPCECLLSVEHVKVQKYPHLSSLSLYLLQYILLYVRIAGVLQLLLFLNPVPKSIKLFSRGRPPPPSLTAAHLHNLLFSSFSDTTQ